MSGELTQEELCDFLEFVQKLEMLEPPDRTWVLRQREKPVICYETMTGKEISERFRAFELARIGTTFSAFRERLGENFPKAIERNLTECCAFVSSALCDQHDYGTWPPPGYAKRIGVILRKAKRKDLSDRFDAAYSKLIVE
ncbi:hypothetical protein [Aliiroseovarius crassostreae]|uniref:hypothetical protein n=1 Tax=Aliiroseovarius crassostreae TaxID=154981 RepID=UPI0021FEA1CE|nr:hypothetical protein [Aliiroseovarius crassostreae]UWQ04456.1 hypothetical protein K3X22_12415 [Aliiroseovarius crassostreae]